MDPDKGDNININEVLDELFRRLSQPGKKLTKETVENEINQLKEELTY